MRECPSCKAMISAPASEGGVRIKNRYLRVTPEGRIVLGCPKCAAEFEMAPIGAIKLMLHRKPAPTT